MMSGVTRIAMWSGPRNISTAMMRSFENRKDCAVVDEPFYAAYLEKTGLEHPLRAEVLAAQSIDPDEVIQSLQDSLPDASSASTIQYQKHMTQHMLPHITLDWLDTVTSCFLIRSPDEIIASYLQKRDAVTAQDLGLERQFELFEVVRKRTGRVPPVLDSNDVLKDPKGILKKLCNRIDIDFVPEMLAWPAGKRDSDGVWAAHWYASVERSTGFTPYTKREAALPEGVSELAVDCFGFYEQLAEHKL